MYYQIISKDTEVNKWRNFEAKRQCNFLQVKCLDIKYLLVTVRCI